MPTRDRWLQLCSRLGAHKSSEEAFDSIVKAYSEPHRAYHNLAHLSHCLREFEGARHLADRPDEVEASLWFHDAVYDTHARDNEARSAAWAREVLSELGTSAETSEYVAKLVMATRHDSTPFDNNAAVLVDIDLSILGNAPEAFDLYERQIRQEYTWVPEPEFRQARARILKAFLSRPQIYQTAIFIDRNEQQARLNLARSLVQLLGDSQHGIR